MRVSYRWSSGLVIVAYGLSLVSDSLFGMAKPAKLGLGWDPCSSWEQSRLLFTLSKLICTIAVPTMLVQGLRNRAAPRWLAILAFPAVFLVSQHWLWRVQSCYSTAGTTGFWVDVSALCIMCLHHIIQRPVTRP